MTAAAEEIRRGLRYPWGTRNSSASDTPIMVAPGVYWARFPMPSDLDHINLWLIEDDGGWTVVDTCLDLPDSRLHWERLFSGLMQGKPVKRIICTHLHPDHVGLAGWLAERFDAELLMTRQEFLMCRALTSDTGKPAPPSALDFYRAAGYSESDVADYQQRFGAFGQVIYPLPSCYKRLVDQQTLRIGNHDWQVIIGNGHSPEHACLLCPALKLLISGDQILPGITSNVSVFPLEPQENPLQDWLHSCRRLRGLLSSDLLVLPAHETPFYGIASRLTDLIDSHLHDLEALWTFMDRPMRVVDCFPALFKRAVGRSQLGLATGEALAHLNYLIGERRVACSPDAQGVNWYARTDVAEALH